MSTITVRVDEPTKQTAALVLGDIGLDLSTAVRMFLRQVVLRGRMPVELMQDPFYAESNLAVLRQSIQQLDEGKVVIKTLDELRAME
jgi:DNA-damage-inducible protein J